MNHLQNDRENGCRERQRSRDSGRGGTEGQTDSVEGFSLRGEVTFRLGATPSSPGATCSSSLVSQEACFSQGAVTSFSLL